MKKSVFSIGLKCGTKIARIVNLRHEKLKENIVVEYYFPILCWTYKVVYQNWDVVTLLPSYTHASIQLFFAASCGKKPSYDYQTYKKHDIYQCEKYVIHRLIILCHTAFQNTGISRWTV